MAKRNNISRLDLGYAQAATILAAQSERAPITIMLVGCGGTGSYMAQTIGRLLRALNDSGKPARGVFVDHDTVEPQNIGRQLFCDAELGANKAEALAQRYGAAWGLDVTAIATRFTAASHRLIIAAGLLVVVGCVDNAAARKELAGVLKVNSNCYHKSGCTCAPTRWWLDCGNHEEAGQVLLGSELDRERLNRAFPSKTICQRLPAPSLQRPELLIPKRAETSAKKKSCAELATANLQSLNINSRVAAEASDMLTRLLLTRNLKRFACEINLAAGSMRSTYATPEAVRGATS